MEGGNPNVNIGNYKGVMLCNRPFAGVNPVSYKEPDANKKTAFLTGIQAAPIGQNVPIFNEPLHAIKRDKKNTALSKHKKWLHDLQKERDRLEEALHEDEDEKQRRKERFSKREADFRSQVRRTNPEDFESDKKLKRPMWALTKETAEEKKDREEEEDVEDLLDFANNLDIDSFMDDVEIKAQVAQMNEQLTKLQEIVNQEEADEKKAEIKDMLKSESYERQTLNAAALSRLDNSDAKRNLDDDAGSIASTVLSECKSIRSVHSTRSVMALTRRAEDKLLNRLDSVSEGVPEPHVVTHDEECGMRLQNNHLPSNLPYIHRNPAI